MKCPPILASEAERLKALSQYGFDDRQPLPSLDSVVRIAARMFAMPFAAVNMIGSDHVFFAASIGIGDLDMRRDVSFCAHAIAQEGVMVIPDATADGRFHDNPLVTGAAGVRFYAGVPLFSHDGLALGALCIIDSRPHDDFSAEDRDRLLELATMASDRLELRRIGVAAARSLSAQQPRMPPPAAGALYRLTHFDSLTGLANRARFFRRVEETLAQPQAAAVVIIDLDGFKDINDTLGPAVGDALLRLVAERLTACAAVGDTVARLGGDEFALLLPGVGDPDEAVRICDHLHQAIARPMILDGEEIQIAISSGLALAPLHAQSPFELLGNADLALFKAKASRRGKCCVFEPALRQAAVARHLHGMEICRAVKEGEFLLFYQPQIRLTDGALCGAEALIRWRHPVRGLLSPAAFLPALEGGPLAATVGAWVLDEACAQAAQWRRQGAADFRIGINLFAAQFQVGDLAADVLDALARHGLPPTALELEITENIALDHDDLVLAKLRALRDHGVGLSFDDFGTGFASLSLLKRYPLTRIKIDRSFVEGMLTSKRDAAVIRAILDIARDFDLETIAEGIEQPSERDSLLRQGCDEGQGYLFGKPMPAPHFAEIFGIGPLSRSSLYG